MTCIVIRDTGLQTRSSITDTVTDMRKKAEERAQEKKAAAEAAAAEADAAEAEVATAVAVEQASEDTAGSTAGAQSDGAAEEEAQGGWKEKVAASADILGTGIRSKCK